jgi:hypothetical protein
METWNQVQQIIDDQSRSGRSPQMACLPRLEAVAHVAHSMLCDMIPNTIGTRAQLRWARH